MPMAHDGASSKGASRATLVTTCVALTLMVVLFVCGLLTHHAPAGDGHEAADAHATLPRLWPVGILPFVLLLGAIAVLPLISRAAHWWHQNRNKFAVAVALAALTCLYLVGIEGPHAATVAIEHGIFMEFVPFIVLLFSLYVVAGGISVTGDLPAHPWTNTAILSIGAAIASIVGTTGASMLLIRPLLQTNAERRRVAHTVIFFIFVVSNAGGLLLPVGDPPLFLGYLHGVPFLWTLTMWREWLFMCVALLVVHPPPDEWMWRHERPADRQRDDAIRVPIRVRGLINFVWLALVVLAVALIDPRRPLPGTTWYPWPFLREGVMLLLTGLSLLTTPAGVRAENRFSYGAILEVAALFCGIFITMQVPLAVLQVAGPSLGLREPTSFFWLTGILSSMLDNAPTYEVFFQTAVTVTDPALVGAIPVDRGLIDPMLLRAVSLGAVLMGANTYIGNGPNFMVKSIAEQAGVRMPSFFGYMIWSVIFLVPLFVVVNILFLR